MHSKALATYLILAVVMLGINISSVLAKDAFYLKDGLYVPEKDQCYKVNDEYHIEGDDYNGHGIYVQTKKGSVVEIYLELGQGLRVKKVVRKNNNLYAVSFEYHNNRITQDHTYVYKIHSDTSFTEVEEVYADDIDIRCRNFKPTTYKYCGDQHIFDEREEYERKNNLSKPNATNTPKQNKKQVAKEITGSWSGHFPVRNSNGKSYMLNMTYVITRDSTNGGMYHFTQTSLLKFDNPTDVFGCTNTNSYSNSYQGDIIEEQGGYKFVQKTVSNPKCGTPDIDLYRLNGERIDVVNVNGGKITGGYLTRN